MVGLGVVRTLRSRDIFAGAAGGHVMPPQTIDSQEQEGHWCIQDGAVVQRPPTATYRDDGPENLTYNNPYNLDIERVWFDGHIVYAVEQGDVDLEFDEQRTARNNKVAQEYQIVFAVKLDQAGKLEDGQEPDRVDGQYNIYDSVPGMEKYSPLWQFNYVVVPRDYAANSLRSEADCLNSGYPILKGTIVEN
jgi:hypothetical protein